MAYSLETRLMVQVASACGVSCAEIKRTLGPVSRTQRAWLVMGEKERQDQVTEAIKMKDPQRFYKIRREAHKKWLGQNKEKFKLIAKRALRKMVAKNPEKFRERKRRHRRQNPARYNELSARRRCKRRLYPMNKIERLMCQNYYEMARELTERTGIKYHVDHIWPLSKGGPHLPWNLRVITAEENLSKGARI